MIEKDGSIYELVFSRDFGVKKKNLKEEEPSVLFLKNNFFQNRHVFLKYAQDDLPGNLRSSGCERCKAHSLSASPSCHCGCQVLSAGLHWATSLQPFPQREKL